MDLQYCRYEKNGPIAEVTIARPQVLNALHPGCDEEMFRVWEDVASDDAVRVAILTGEGDRAFCSGFDLKWAQKSGFEATSGQWAPFGGLAPRPGDRPPPRVMKPIIAAINGLALGGGLELLLHCDLAIAADHAEFGLPEPRWGLVPRAGGVHWLVRHVPLKRALGYLLTGRRFSAAEAYQVGLVTEVVPGPRVRETARAWAEEILRCGPLAVAAIKEATYGGLGLGYREAADRRYPLWEAALRSDEWREGLAAFAEKREPRWRTAGAARSALARDGGDR